MQKAFSKGQRILMGIASVHVFLMRQIFFVPCHEVEHPSKQIEAAIAFCPKKSFVTMVVKTLNLYGTNGGFKQQNMRVDPYFVVRQTMVTIIDAMRISMRQIFVFIANNTNGNGVVPRQKINDVLKPG